LFLSSCKSVHPSLLGGGQGKDEIWKMMISWLFLPPALTVHLHGEGIYGYIFTVGSSYYLHRHKYHTKIRNGKHIFEIFGEL
jgi:hypothetical protein